PELAAALDADPAARRTFDGLSNSNKSWHTYQVDNAKTDETRQRRIAKSIDALRASRPR
ncbi:MAG TPA: YdeI/OmpD-associated family protein, partial [Verrucomicrobiae bacterium]|nr:YdeI/OmpD-associated family protein [Verrucomicrobiae bacterium]